MPATYEPIATTTLGSAASSITFSSIPGTYTDLRLVLVGTNASGDYWTIRFNSDTGSNYSCTYLEGTGSAADTFRFTNQTFIYIAPSSISTTVPTFSEVNIFNYAGSTNKTTLHASASDRNGSGWVNRLVGLWRNTNAITSLSVQVSNGTNIASGTTATLYGILKA